MIYEWWSKQSVDHRPQRQLHFGQHDERELRADDAVKFPVMQGLYREFSQIRRIWPDIAPTKAAEALRFLRHEMQNSLRIVEGNF
jgi:hypothetical protein